MNDSTGKGTMDAPTSAKGHFYNSNRISKCPLMHLDITSHKCQNYDKHNMVCVMCESRVNPPLARLGGTVSEGTYAPDIQEAVKILQDARHQSMIQKDDEIKMINGRDITNKYDKERQAHELLANYTQTHLTLEEKMIEEYTTNAKAAQYLSANEPSS